MSGALQPEQDEPAANASDFAMTVEMFPMPPRSVPRFAPPAHIVLHDLKNSLDQRSAPELAQLLQEATRSASTSGPVVWSVIRAADTLGFGPLPRDAGQMMAKVKAEPLFAAAVALTCLERQGVLGPNKTFPRDMVVPGLTSVVRGFAPHYWPIVSSTAIKYTEKMGMGAPWEAALQPYFASLPPVADLLERSSEKGLSYSQPARLSDLCRIMDDDPVAAACVACIVMEMRGVMDSDWQLVC